MEKEAQLAVSRRSVTVGALIVFASFLSFASSASALTLGVGWSGDPAANNAEMPLVAKAGASTFRVPFGGGIGNQAGDDSLVEAAAERGVTIHAEVSPGYPLPTGQGRSDFINWTRFAVERYGYEGQFWKEPSHASLPYRPITSWEIMNEPNLHSVGAIEYGQFLNEVANAIQAGSQSKAGRSTDVLFGGILAWGNVGTGSIGYQGALNYLADAYPYFGSTNNVTGVAIHPYELDPATFYQPPGQPRYGYLEAFKFAVAGFHAELVELAKGGSQKSLWITEAGWPAEGPQYSVGANEQANLLKQVVDYLRNNESSLNVKDFLWYNFRDAPGTSNWDNFCGLRAHDGSFRPAWTSFQEKAGVPLWTPPPSAPPVMAVVTPKEELYVKAGSLTAEWVKEASGIKSVSLASDPTSGPLIGVITNNGHALVKKGLYGEWVDETAGASAISVATDSTNGPLIGVITNNGHALVKKGLYGEWVDETGGASAISVATDSTNGPLIGVLLATGHAMVKQGSLYGSWVDETGGASAISVATDSTNGPLIGVLLATGHAMVKQGSLYGSWVDETAGASTVNVATDWSNGPLIGVLLATGHAVVKQGSLYGSWVDETAGASAISVAADWSNGPLVGVLTAGGDALVKQGGLFSQWTDEFGGVNKLVVAY